MRHHSDLCILLFAILASTTTTYAGCTSTIQGLQREADALGLRYEQAEKTGFSSGPTEADAQALISCLQTFASPNESNDVRSIAYLELSGLWGYITKDFRNSSLAKKGPGKTSWDDINLSVQLNPQNERAWTTFGTAILNLRSNYSGLEKMAIQHALGISLDKEKEFAIDGLKALPNRTSESNQVLNRLNNS